MLAVVVDPQAEDPVVGVERQLGLGDVVAALHVGQKASLRSPVHFTGRPSSRAAQPTMRVFGVEEDLHAEAAADVGRQDAELLGRRP